MSDFNSDTSYRLAGEDHLVGGNGDYAGVDVPLPNIGGNEPPAAAASVGVSVSTSMFERLGWMGGLLGFTLALAIVSFVLVLVLWFRVDDNKKTIKQMLVFPNNGISQPTNMWSSVYAALPLSTGFTASPMMFSVATPVGTTLAIDAQTGPSSVMSAHLPGTIDGMNVQINSLPSTGFVSVMVTINGVVMSKTEARITPTSSSVVNYVRFACPLKFKKGDTIGLTQTVAAGTVVPAGTLTTSAQPYMHFEKCK